MRYATEKQLLADRIKLEEIIYGRFIKKYGIDYYNKYSASTVVDLVYGISFNIVNEYYFSARVKEAADLILNKLGIIISK